MRPCVDRRRRVRASPRISPGAFVAAPEAPEHAGAGPAVAVRIAGPELYDHADEQGLHVWQDLPLQWGYARSVRHQAVVQARAAVDTLVVDKTGTLTEGKPRLTKTLAADGFDAGELLRLAASLERHSEHPLASAIVPTSPLTQAAPGRRRPEASSPREPLRVYTRRPPSWPASGATGERR